MLPYGVELDDVGAALEKNAGHHLLVIEGKTFRRSHKKRRTSPRDEADDERFAIRLLEQLDGLAGTRHAVFVGHGVSRFVNRDVFRKGSVRGMTVLRDDDTSRDTIPHRVNERAGHGIGRLAETDHVDFFQALLPADRADPVDVVFHGGVGIDGVERRVENGDDILVHGSLPVEVGEESSRNVLICVAELIRRPEEGIVPQGVFEGAEPRAGNTLLRLSCHAQPDPVVVGHMEDEGPGPDTVQLLSHVQRLSRAIPVQQVDGVVIPAVGDEEGPFLAVEFPGKGLFLDLVPARLDPIVEAHGGMEKNGPAEHDAPVGVLLPSAGDSTPPLFRARRGRSRWPPT